MTHDEIHAAFNAALKKIKTGVLKTSPEDIAFIERLVVQHILVNKLEPTEANFSGAFIALATVLPWAVKPAKLVAEEQNERPATTESAQESQQAWSDKTKAAEKADAKLKADEASIAQAKDLIAAYNPVKNNRFDAREQMDRQAEWTAALNQAIEKKRDLQIWTKALAETIQKRYADRERASERV